MPAFREPFPLVWFFLFVEKSELSTIIRGVIHIYAQLYTKKEAFVALPPFENFYLYFETVGKIYLNRAKYLLYSQFKL